MLPGSSRRCVSDPSHENQRLDSRIAIAAVVVILLVVGGGWFAWIYASTPASTTRVATIPTAEKHPRGIIEKDGWKTTSAGGTSIELIGVGRFPNDDGKWWKPDGTPAPTTMPIVEQRNWPHRDRLGYKLFFRADWQGKQVGVAPKPGSPARLMFWS